MYSLMLWDLLSLGRMYSRLPHALSTQVDWDSCVQTTVSDGSPRMGYGCYASDEITSSHRLASHLVTAERKVGGSALT